MDAHFIIFSTISVLLERVKDNDKLGKEMRLFWGGTWGLRALLDSARGGNRLLSNWGLT